MEWIPFSLLYVVLFFIFHSSSSPFFSSSTTVAGIQCHPDERSALLSLKSTFSIFDISHASCYATYSNGTPSIPTSSWKKNTNCCRWDGITCDTVTGHVVGLNLGCNRLKGAIHSNSSLFFLHHLQMLDLSGNDFSGYAILPEFGHFKHLTHLSLLNSNFSGNVPLEISHLSKLVYFNLADNKLSIGAATFKALARNLTNLEKLLMSENNMSLVPLVSLMNLSTSLTSLFLDHCQIRGELPAHIFQWHKLETLDLSGNDLSGQIPLSSLDLEPLSYLDLSNNNFTGQLPELYSNSTQTFSSYFSSEYPLGGFHSSLYYLDLSSNLLNGTIPSWISKLPYLSSLSISRNLLTGEIAKINKTSLSILLLSRNHFVGEIPTSFCKMTSLLLMDLAYNNLSGNIPPCFRNLSNSLQELYLRTNRFHGMIPLDFAEGNSLRILSLNGNQLEGSLPQSLVNCERLQILDAGNNKLNGTFPHWLESLPNLQVLILRSNGFYGPLSNPKVRYPFQSLRIMDISNNEFTGVLPTKYFKNFRSMIDAHTKELEYMTGYAAGEAYYSVMLTIKGFYVDLERIQKMFITIDFSSNNFTGEIPIAIGKLNSLKGLNFSNNKLTGPIPPSLGNVSNLEWLDLSSNEFSGNIPWQLAANLNQLQILNLSNNKLEGQIPHGKQFNTFNNDSFSGNPELCGFPLSESCNNVEAQPDQRGNDGEHNNLTIEWKVVMMGYGSGMIIGISVGYMVLFSERFDYWFFKRFGGGRLSKTNARSRGRRR